MMVIKFDGVEYEVESLELGELEWLEEDLEKDFDEINFGAARTVLRIVWLFQKRDQPDLTLDDVRRRPISMLLAPEDAPAKKKPTAKARPTRQRRK